METVRLTIQLRDEANRVRLTEHHHDIPVGKVSERAAEIGRRMSAYYRKEKRETESQS